MIRSVLYLVVATYASYLPLGDNFTKDFGFTCFDNAIPEVDRRYLDGIDGNLPFRIASYGRTLEMPQTVFQDAMLILMREKLGVHSEIAVNPTANGQLTSDESVRIVAGCEDISTSECNMRTGDYRGEAGHFYVAVWQSYGAAALAENELNLDATFGANPKAFGAHGSDGLFTKQSNIKAAADDSGLDLKWVGNYNVKSREAKQYFHLDYDTLKSQVVANDCSTLRFMEEDVVGPYRTVSGDVNGGPESCVDGWWFSAACRDSPADCIPVLTTGNGWSLPNFMQYSYFYNMPLVIGTVDWADYVALGKVEPVMMYWWYPDMTFARDLPKLVQGPPANPTEQAQGIWSTANAKDVMINLRWRGLEDLDPKTWELAGNLYINDYDAQDAMDMLIAADVLRHYDAEGGGDEAYMPERYSLACEWLKTHENIWNVQGSEWMPDKTDCRGGEGVVVKGSNVFCAPCEGELVSVFDETLGHRTCGQCGVGTVNVDGKCTACPTGFYNDEVGAVECKACGPGTFGSEAGGKSADVCKKCVEGTYAMQPGTAVCPSCPSGTHNVGDGMVQCAPCEAGKYSVAQADGMQVCIPCHSGHYCPEGAPAPLLCESGHFSGEGMEACERCPARQYQDLIGQVECKPCQPLFTSPPGSTTVEDCVCPQDSYYSEAKDDCIKCLPGMVCLQGKEIPFVEAGMYAEAKEGAFEGRYEQVDGKWEYTTKLSADMAEDTMMFSELQMWVCPYGELACPGTTLERDGYVAENARKVNECAGNLFMHGCSRCPDNFYFSKDNAECLECAGGDGALYPIIYVIGLAIMYGLYKITKYRASQKLTNMLMFSCSGSLLLNFFQMLGVVGFYAAEFPDFLAGFFDFFKLFAFDLDVLRSSCATGSDFHSRFLTRTMSPLIFMLSFLAFYPVSLFLNKVTADKVQAMDGLNVINAAGLITNAGYIALCKISMQYYECRSQPSAPSTVAAYPDIECQSDEHSSMMPIAILCTMVYGIGIYFLCLYLCFVAPQRMMESQSFRRKTRFLVGRWNPGRWYWGPVLQTRNLLVSLVVVFYPSDGMMQFLLTGTLVLLYTAAQSTMEPWRDLFLNVTDTVLGLTITLTCMFGTLLVEDQGARGARQASAQAYLTAIFTVSFLALGYAIGLAFYSLLREEKCRARDAKFTREATKIILLQTKKVSQLCAQGATEDEIALAVSSYLTLGEQKQIFKLGRVLLHELCGVKYASSTNFKRIMLNKVEGKEIDLEQVDVDMLAEDEVCGENGIQKAGRISAMSKLGGTFR